MLILLSYIQKLTHMVLKGAMIKDILFELATLLDKEVVFCDPYFREKEATINDSSINIELHFDLNDLKKSSVHP